MKKKLEKALKLQKSGKTVEAAALMDSLNRDLAALKKGLDLQTAGKFSEAISVYRAIASKTAEAKHLESLCWKALNNAVNAIKCAREAVKIEPIPVYQNALAGLLILQNSCMEAIAISQSVLLNQPDDIDALINISTAYRRVDEQDSALEAATRAHSIDADRWEPIAILAGISIDRRNHIEGLKLILSILDRPETSYLLIDLFQTLMKLELFEIAENRYAKLRPLVDLTTRARLDLVIAEMEILRSRLESARHYIKSAKETVAAIDIRQKNSLSTETLILEAKLMSKSGDLQRASDIYKNLLEIHNESNLIRWNKSLVELARGNLREGWILFESRWEWREFPSARRKFDLPRWEKQKDGRVLVWGEQGVGDEIIFMSMINDLIEDNIDFKLELSKKVVPLACELFGPHRVRESGPTDSRRNKLYTEFKYQIPIGSLAKFYRNDERSFEKKPLQLAKSAFVRKHVEYSIKTMFGFHPTKIVGLCWRSSNLAAPRKEFFLDVHNLKDILLNNKIPDIGYVSLQYDAEREEIAYLRSHRIPVFAPAEIDQMNDILAASRLAGACDYVVTSGTAVLFQSALAGTKTLTWGFRDSWSYCGFDAPPWYPNIESIMLKRPRDNEYLHAEILRHLERHCSVILP